jgi:hypothetical protein
LILDTDKLIEQQVMPSEPHALVLEHCFAESAFAGDRGWDQCVTPEEGMAFEAGVDRFWSESARRSVLALDPAPGGLDGFETAAALAAALMVWERPESNKSRSRQKAEEMGRL